MTTDIFTFSAQLQDGLRVELSTTELASTPVQAASRAISVLQKAILELKAFCRNYRFNNPDEEIKFFKEVKPVLMSQYLFQRGVYKASVVETFSDPPQKIKYYNDALTRLQNFALRNAEFYQYCLAGNTHYDHQYFTRQPQAQKCINRDDNFSTTHDMKFAKVLAHELLREYFRKALERLQSDSGYESSPMEWTASKMAAIELVYALQAAGAVNNGKSEMKYFIAAFERVFKISLGNFYRGFHELTLRKGNRTTFLDFLRERLTQKLDDRDE